MSKITCKAFGKINLTLDVLGKRSDGYHEIVTLFQGINLYDEIYLEKRDDESIVLSCDLPELSTGPGNLVYQAAHLLKDRFPYISGVQMHLKKRIPLAAGLGGGSADAAMVLLGINHLFELNLTREELGLLGAKLGSDVLFCFYPLTAIGEGKGERLSFCDICPEMWLVLLKPPFGLLAKEVYANLALTEIRQRPELNKVLQGIHSKKKKLIYPYIGNVLEYPAFALYPQLKFWVQEIAKLGAEKVMMSGSGPTLLAFMESKEKAEQLAVSFAQPGWWVQVARTTTSGDLRGRMIDNEGKTIEYRGVR